MAYQRSTLTEIVTRIVTDITTRLGEGTVLLRRSITRNISKAYAGSVHLLYGNIEYNKDQLFVTYSDEDYLLLHGNEYGVPRNNATSSDGPVIVTGTNGVVIPAGRVIQSATGYKYTFDSDYTITGGSVTGNVTAAEAGENYNEEYGAILTFVNPVTGADSQVTVGAGGIVGGTDIEDIEDYRQRVLARKRRPAHGGADFDYVAWMQEISGNTRAWAINEYQGEGTIGCAFVRDDDNFIPTDTQLADTKAYIISHVDPLTGETVGAPVNAVNGIYMIKLSRLEVPVSIELYPNTVVNQNLVTSIYNELIINKGGPEQAIYKSDINTAVGSVADDIRYRVTLSGDADYISANASQVHVPGVITFFTYNG